MKRFKEFPYERWCGWIERRRRAIFAATLVLCVGSAVLSVTRLELDVDVLSMLPAGRPAFDDFKYFVADFGELNELVIMLEGAPLEDLERFADAFGSRLAKLEIVRSVHVRMDVEGVRTGVLGRRLFNYVPVEAYDRLEQRLTREGIAAQVRANREILAAPFDLEAVRAVRDDPLGIVPLATEQLSRARGQFLAMDPSGYVVAPAKDALLIFIEPRASAFDSAFSERLMREVRAAEEETRQASELGAVHAAYTGSYVYALEDSAMLRGDIERYTVLALFGVLASFFIGYGNLRLLPYLTVPLLVATLVDFALSILLFDQLNASSLAFAAILYGLSIDSGIHFYTRLLQCPPSEGSRAVTTTLRALGRAHVGAATTTAAAFFLIGFSELVAVRQLGIMSGIGMLLTTVQFFTLYPALGFVMLERGKVKARTLDSPLIAEAGELAVRWRRALVAGVLTLAVGLAFVARNVEFDASLDHLRPQDSAAIRVEREIAKRFSSQSWTGAILVRRPALEDALADSEAVVRALDELKTRGTASAFQSITAVLPSERTQRERLERYEKLARADAADWLRAELAGAGFALQPFTPFLDAFRAGASEIVRLGDPTLAPFEPLIARQVRQRPGGYTVATYVAPAPGVAIETLRTELDARLAGVDFVFASRTLLEHELHAVMKNEIAFFFGAAIVVNYLLLLLNGATLLEAVGLLFPTVFALELLMAGMVVFGVALDPVNVVIVALILGLGVDYGCFTAAAERERGGWGPGLRHCGRAVVLTWLTTVVGFGFLAPSHYPALARLGQLASVGLSLSLVMAMTLIPALLSVVRGRDTERAQPDS